MLEKLLNSKTRTHLLSLFFESEGKKFYIQEIIKLTNMDPANVHRELVKLHRLSVLKNERIANQKYYCLNKEHDYYKGLKELFKSYNKLEGREKIVVLEEMPDYGPFVVATAWSRKIANDFFKEFGLNNRFSKLLAIYNNNYGALCVVKKEFDSLSREIIKKFIDNPVSGDKYNQLISKKHQKLFKATKEYLKINLSSLTNKELYRIYKKYYQPYEDIHRLHWIQSASDFGDNLLSKYLLDYLKDKVDSKKYSIGDIFSILTTPIQESYASKEYVDLLKILVKINDRKKVKEYFKKTETRIIAEGLKKIDQEIDSDIKKHAERWGWMGFGFTGPAWDIDYFIDILGSFVRQKSKPEILLKKYKEEKDELIVKQRKLLRDTNIDEPHVRLFKIARDLVHSKAIRKDSMFFYFYALDNFMKEICKRYYLSLNQVRYFYHHELEVLLLKNSYDSDVLNARRKYSIYYSTGHFSRDLLLEGDKAGEFIKKLNIIQENIEDVKILQGDCASSGRVRGEVTNVNTIDDIKRMKEGNVLVSIATNPNLVPAIKKAAAIVTDIGGITCHAAIISRELGIPCVIGTRIATKILKDGDIIDVDATHGKVTVIKKK